MMNEKYSLLKAWQQGQLKQVWEQECATLKQQDPKLLDWVVKHEAAARVSGRISQEYELLAHVAWKVATMHRLEPDYTDADIEFYDALQDDSLKSYRETLQNISGNRSLMADEIRYMESIGYMTPEQMEAYEYEVGKMYMETL